MKKVVKWSSGQVVKWILLTHLLTYSLIYCLYSATPHTITVDGNLSDWSADELMYNDPLNDGTWGYYNQVDDLYLTWDSNNLYIGVSGVQKDGNCLVIYLDVGSNLGFGDYSDASTLKDPNNPSLLWWWARNNKFPPEFLPDYQLHLYEMKLNPNEGHGLFRYTTNGQITAVTLSSCAYTGGGTGNFGSVEVAIPWTGIYPGYGGKVPSNSSIKIIAAMCGGNDGTHLGSVHDSAPDQANNFTNEWYGQFTFDTWLTALIDQNKDGMPDNNRSTIARKLSVNAGDGSVYLSWQKRGYPEKNLSGYKIYYKKSRFSGDFLTSGAASVLAGDATSYTISGLENNNTYYFVVTAIAADNTGSGCSEEVSAWVHGPTIKHIPVTRFSYPGKDIRLNAAVADSSGIGSVKFYYRQSGQPEYFENTLSPSAGVYSYTIPGSSISTTGIEYYFWAQNSNGDVNISSSAIIIISVNSGVYSAGSQFELSLPDDSVTGQSKIIIPPYAADGNIEIAAESKQPSDVYSYPVLPQFLDSMPVCVYEFYGISPSGEKISVSFKKEAEIHLKYFDDDLNNSFQENLLSPYVWTGREWIPLKNFTLDTANNLITAKTGHISKFAVFYTGSSAGQDASKKLRRVVNPSFLPDRGDVVQFDSDEMPLKIEIFNTSGGLIRKVEGLDYWDGRDKNGDIATGGVYIYRILYNGKIISGTCVVVK